LISTRQRILTTLDAGLDCCVKNWRVMPVLIAAGTFVFFTIILFFGLTVAGALAATKVLAAIEFALAGAILVLHLKYRHQISQWLDAADAIEAMLCKDDVFSDWDDFIADPASDPELERIRLHCLRLPQEFPPAAPDEYCSQPGIEELHGYVRRLRTGLATRVVEVCAGLWSAWRASKKPADADPCGATLPDEPELKTAVKPKTTVKATATKATTTKTTTTKKTTKKTTTKKATATKKATKKKWVA
jgi:hypothetical protein